jgi:hypothetical protein
MSYFIAGLVQAFFWLIALSVALWLCRRWFPTWERMLFDVGAIEGLKMLIRRVRMRFQGRQPEPPVPSAPSQAGTRRDLS